MHSEYGQQLMTADEVAEMSVPDKSVELVRGLLVVSEPASTEHGRIQANLTFFLTAFVRAHELGVVFGQDTGFKIQSNPDTVRGPDIAFLAKERAGSIPKRGYAALAPDLVAEIVSPDDRPGEVLAKVADWLEAGTRLVWVIDSQRAAARAYRANGSFSFIPSDGWLDGEDVVPGFRCTLAEVLQ